MSNVNSIQPWFGPQTLEKKISGCLLIAICSTFLSHFASPPFSDKQKCRIGLCEPVVHFLFVRAGALVGFRFGQLTRIWLESGCMLQTTVLSHTFDSVWLSKLLLNAALKLYWGNMTYCTKYDQTLATNKPTVHQTVRQWLKLAPPVCTLVVFC